MLVAVTFVHPQRPQTLTMAAASAAQILHTTLLESDPEFLQHYMQRTLSDAVYMALLILFFSCAVFELYLSCTERDVCFN
jgi:hypothetical protein